MEPNRTTALAARLRDASAAASRRVPRRIRPLVRDRRVRAAGQPEAPVLVIGRRRPYLDVRWLVEDAEGHLANDFARRLLHPWDVACYDRFGRPLDLTIRADGTVGLLVSDAPPDPVALRERLTAVCAEAREAHATVAEEDRCDLRELELPDGDIPALAVAMARRFGHPRERITSVNGEGQGSAADGNGEDSGFTSPSTDHSGSRLHNFWHAIS